MSSTERFYRPSRLAGLPGMPQTIDGIRRRAEREHWIGRKASGRSGGGGLEYSYDSLPPEARDALDAREAHAAARDALAKAAPVQGAEERRRPGAYDNANSAGKAAAERRFQALAAVEALQDQGRGRMAALAAVAESYGESPATLRRWFDLVKGVPLGDRLDCLTPRYRGRKVRAAGCHPEAWAFFKRDYLRNERPCAATCYRELLRAAAAPGHGWSPIPSLATLQRRILREVPRQERVFLREGPDALARTLPSQKRDPLVFAALEAFNADGHDCDTMVRWEDGSESRPVLVALQDVRTRKCLAHRIAPTEDAYTFLLAVGDMVDRWGVPRHGFVDNGHAFSAKWMTGGATNRHRFKTPEVEPVGVLTGLGIHMHFTQIYHGQSKPIERMFLDFSQNVSQGLACAGAYVGNKPTAKPANYGSRAIPIAEYRKIATSGIAEYNARPGRDTDACRGVLSFDQAFEESYTKDTVRWLSADQRRRLLLPAENVLAHRQNGQITLFDNTYYDSRLAGHAGERLTVRFDPADLHGSVHVFGPGGSYICEARCEAPVGFMDMIGVKTDQRLTRRLRKNVRESAKISVDIEVNDLRKKLPLYPVEGGDSSRPVPGRKELVIPRKRAAGGAGRLWTAEQEHAAFTAGMADLQGDDDGNDLAG